MATWGRFQITKFLLAGMLVIVGVFGNAPSACLPLAAVQVGRRFLSDRRLRRNGKDSAHDWRGGR